MGVENFKKECIKFGEPMEDKPGGVKILMFNEETKEFTITNVQKKLSRNENRNNRSNCLIKSRGDFFLYTTEEGVAA